MVLIFFTQKHSKNYDDNKLKNIYKLEGKRVLNSDFQDRGYTYHFKLNFILKKFKVALFFLGLRTHSFTIVSIILQSIPYSYKSAEYQSRLPFLNKRLTYGLCQYFATGYGYMCLCCTLQGFYYPQ